MKRQYLLNMGIALALLGSITSAAPPASWNNQEALQEELEPEEKKRIRKQIENYQIYLERRDSGQRPPAQKKGNKGTNLTSKPERGNKIDKHFLSSKRLTKLRKQRAV